MDNMAIISRLRELSDEKYRNFQAGLIPDLPGERILGVRMPELRRLARELAGTPAADNFMSTLPHRYYDEDCLHGLLINALRDYGETVSALNRFLPFVNNWATCDLIKPKSFKKRPEGLKNEVLGWISSRQTYTVRFGIGVLMNFYLDEGFGPGQLRLASSCCCEEYYVNMMIAWYLATAMAKRPEAALAELLSGRLSPWVMRKTIQKSLESYRVAPKLKAQLREIRGRLT